MASSVFDKKMREIEDHIAPGDWKITERGVYREVPIYKKGEIVDYKTEIASPIPIFPSAILLNSDTKTEKIELTYMKYGMWHTVVTERSITSNRAAIIKLSDYGIEVNSDNAGTLVRYIADVVAGSLFCLPRKSAKSVMGWVGSTFMPYTDNLVFDGAEQFDMLYHCIGSRGKLSDWVDFVKPLRNKLEIRLLLAASFASPLIELTGESPFVFHLWGTSGTAKTVALLLASSIWGDPAMGKMTRTMNMTTNSMLSTAAFLRNLPFCGDELQTIKSAWQNYDKLIMCITEGIDRGRMTYDKVNETKSWKCAFLFTGEEPCTKQSSGGGVKNRVIEVELKDKLVDDGNAVANFARTHFGTAGRAFIEHIREFCGMVDGDGSIPDAVAIQRIYKEYFNRIISAVDTTDKQAGAMAMILTADLLASSLFWPGEKELAVDDIKGYLCSTKETDVAERAYQFIVNAIAENAACFEVGAKPRWGKITTQFAYINLNVMHRVMNEEGYDFDAVKAKWADKGYLIIDKDGKYSVRTYIDGTRPRCACIVYDE